MLGEELCRHLAPLAPAWGRRFLYPDRLPVDDQAALKGFLWVPRKAPLHCEESGAPSVGGLMIRR
ncbi:hypothetical protein BCD48_25415 [Pseudofrankia sp. BMG5.36]|nr:hypothetical protein BCD48_25415 [Pseudofrankia sp. BMG5.36]